MIIKGNRSYFCVYRIRMMCMCVYGRLGVYVCPGMCLRVCVNVF